MNRTPSPRRPGRVAAWALTGALAASALTACSGQTLAISDDPSAETGASAGQPVEGGELVWGIETDITTVNPHRNGQDKATAVLRNAFSPLLYRNGDGQFEPWIAAGVDISEDELTYQLRLRDGVTFSDGAALDAAAVVLTIDKLIDRQAGYVTQTPQGLQFVDSYEATDPKTVTFKLSQPDIQFLLFLSTTQSSPLSPAVWELPQTTLEPGGPQLAGIGPFTIESFTPSTEIVFVKRADYAWTPQSFAHQDHPAPYLDQVTYRVLKEGSTRTGALQQGQIDVASDIQPLDVPLFRDDPAFQYARFPVGGTVYSYYLNVSKAPFDDIRVRQAFILGADYAAILASIFQGTYDRAWAPLSVVGPFADPSLEGWAEVDVDKANQLLDQAGWTERDSDGIRLKDGQRLTVRCPTGAPFVRESRDTVAIAVAAALKQNIGLDFKYEPVDLGTEAELAAANEIELFDNSYGGADPVTGVDLLYYTSDPTRGFLGRGHYDDPELEAVIDQARFTIDLDQRKAAYLKLQEIVTSKFYVLPLIQTQDTYAAQANVHGFEHDTGTGQLLGATTVWIEG
ncbi:MAG: ABC transporter substrate-binding protein [Propionibacteriaceae bacterium]|jgi:peptide/nickel transport system substrate-binding protein|nr:ABC transporter substrate-binding protein [Propionibacteriaceae bacterium]